MRIGFETTGDACDRRAFGRTAVAAAPHSERWASGSGPNWRPSRTSATRRPASIRCCAPRRQNRIRARADQRELMNDDDSYPASHRSPTSKFRPWSAGGPWASWPRASSAWPRISLRLPPPAARRSLSAGTAQADLGCRLGAGGRGSGGGRYRLGRAAGPAGNIAQNATSGSSWKPTPTASGPPGPMSFGYLTAGQACARS